MYLADIDEYSDINLYLYEIHEVVSLDATTRLHEGLVFNYKGGSSKQWPLHHILKEGFKTLLMVYFGI